MSRKKFPTKLRLLGVVLPWLLLGAVRGAEIHELNVRVSESAAPIMQQVQAAFAAAAGGTAINAKVEATAQVIEALAKDEVPVGFITRNVKALDREKAPNLVGTPVGLDALVLTVPTANPVTNLTVDQVRAIWTGEITNWKKVGGPDLAMVVIGRPKAYDRIQLFGDFMKLEAEPVAGGLLYRDKSKEGWSHEVAAAPATDELAVAMLRNTPGAITYFPVEILRRFIAGQMAVKGVALDGCEPTPERIADGTYFIHRTVNVVTKGPPTGSAKAFIDFLLSENGRKLVRESGFLPWEK